MSEQKYLYFRAVIWLPWFCRRFDKDGKVIAVAQEKKGLHEKNRIHLFRRMPLNIVWVLP